MPVVSGRVIFGQADVLSADRDELRRVRSQIGLVFQDPYSSLNPRMTIGDIVGEPIRVQRWICGGRLRVGGEEKERVAELLLKVGLSGEHINRYPHEFSGGQRQRIGIARALALEPKLVICDEPVSSLDVSIQAQILNLLKDLQEELGLTYLFIAHDLAVVEFFCDVVAVMYMGKIVERAEKAELYRNPLHPYTRALMSAIPDTRYSIPDSRYSTSIQHRATSNELRGCGFSPRCALAVGECLKEAPILEEKPPTETFGGEEHFVACWKCKKIDY